MNNKHVTRFGNPETPPDGALYFVQDQHGLYLMAEDLQLFRLSKDGAIITPSIRSNIRKKLELDQENYNENISNMGIPDDLKTLLQLTKKSDVSKHCKRTTISEFDLFLFIQNCAQMDYEYYSKFPVYVPEHLDIHEKDRELLEQGNLSSYTKKMKSLFLERRAIHVHMFHLNDKWHCFYFSYEDIEIGDTNHWKHGSHIHYVSYLWPLYSREMIWDLFNVRRTKISDNIHIRFIPSDYTQSIETSIFDPTAQISSRGFWTAKFYYDKNGHSN